MGLKAGDLKYGDVYCNLYGERWIFVGKRESLHSKNRKVLVFKPFPCDTYIDCKTMGFGYKNFHNAVVVKRNDEATMHTGWFEENCNWIKEKYCKPNFVTT